MDNTPNYGLKKPAQNDDYNIQDQNDNMDIIDTALNNIELKQNGIYLRYNVDTLEWSTDGETWNPFGSGSILTFNYGLPRF